MRALGREKGLLGAWEQWRRAPRLATRTLAQYAKGPEAVQRSWRLLAEMRRREAFRT